MIIIIIKIIGVRDGTSPRGGRGRGGGEVRKVTLPRIKNYSLIIIIIIIIIIIMMMMMI